MANTYTHNGGDKIVSIRELRQDVSNRFMKVKVVPYPNKTFVELDMVDIRHWYNTMFSNHCFKNEWNKKWDDNLNSMMVKNIRHYMGIDGTDDTGNNDFQLEYIPMEFDEIDECGFSTQHYQQLVQILHDDKILTEEYYLENIGDKFDLMLEKETEDGTTPSNNTTKHGGLND